MNHFETNLRRAVFSLRFALAVAVQVGALLSQGPGSALYQLTVPLVCALPFAGSWLEEYKSGFARLALPRGSLGGYIWGRFLACGVSGGGAEALAAWLYGLLTQAEEPVCDLGLLFLTAMLWASAAAALAAASNSKYLAYGGAFVLCYFLVILWERYWPQLYCLYPNEWLAPRHSWVLGSRGTALMLAGMIGALGLVHSEILRRRLEHV